MFIRLLFTVLLAIPAFTAKAQDDLCTHPACFANLATGNACRLYVHSSIGEIGRFRTSFVGTWDGVQLSQPAGCFDPARAYALQGWRFNTRGGHKIRALSFRQTDTGIYFAMRDNDGGDPADGFVWLVPLPEGSEIVSVPARACPGGPCILPLPVQPRPDQIAVLAGFRFGRDRDGHVRRVAVRPVISGGNLAMEMLFDDDGNTFSAGLQYVLLARGTAEPLGEVEARYVSGDPAGLTAASADPDLVLTEFAFTFTNGGHFLEDFGLEPDMGTYSAWFQDHQGDDDRRRPDDPFTWRFGVAQIR